MTGAAAKAWRGVAAKVWLGAVSLLLMAGAACRSEDTPAVPAVTSSSRGPLGTLTVARASLPPSPELAHAELSQRLRQLCHDTAAKTGGVDAIPTATLADMQQAIQALADEVDAVRALTPGADDAEALADYLASLERRLELTRSIFEAVAAGRPPIAVATTQTPGGTAGSSPDERLVHAMISLGLSGCEAATSGR